MRFEKWQALGNDYLIVERDELPFELTPVRVVRLCERHRGAGADGVLLLSRPTDPAHVADLEIFNADGSQAELSGNGAREAALYLRARGWTGQDEFTIATLAGEVKPTIIGPESCRMDMGVASFTSKDFPGGPPDGHASVVADGRTWSFHHVSIGNPQCAIRVGSTEELILLGLEEIGPAIENDARFPNRTNVSWYAEINPPLNDPLGEPVVERAELDARPAAQIRARIFERGVGETLSSGTGAAGAALAYLQATGERAGRRVTVALDGGRLEVEVGEDLRVHQTGWAKPVFAGRLDERFMKALEDETK
jgi:diaminopimelate epimerase